MHFGSFYRNFIFFRITINCHSTFLGEFDYGHICRISAFYWASSSFNNQRIL